MATALKTPIMEWQWLHEMEISGSIAPQTGWLPRHLTVWQADRLVGAAPLYIKTHSQGEFVFDQWWAKWAEESGIQYYPKLIGMSPATPAVGYRFLIAPEADSRKIQQVMFAAVDGYCRDNGLSGSHFLFVDPNWQQETAWNGWTGWRHQSFLWENRDCHTFDDYLKPFKSIQRRNIRRERQRLDRAHITIHAMTGNTIDPDWADRMYDYYLNTNAQYGPWAARYFNADFFRGIFKRYRDRLLLFAAHQNGQPEPLALSLLVYKGSQLIGRYWGSASPVKDLHFNMCFYEPIQWAIDHGITAFDPGAGSAHKLYRGFRAVANTSLHKFHHPVLKDLFNRFIQNINAIEQANIEELNRMLPFSSLTR